MQRQQTVVRLALMISLILHLAVFLNMRGINLRVRTYKTSDAVNVYFVNPPKSPIKPPPQTPRRISRRENQPIRRTRIARGGASPGRVLVNKLPPREISAKIASRSLTEAKIPAVDAKIEVPQVLPNTISSSTGSSSAMGTSSQGKGTGQLSGNGRDGGSKGGVAFIPPRDMSKADVSISEKFQTYTKTDVSFIKALQEIAQHILKIRKSQKIDMVFIIDTSESMQDDINSVRRNLNIVIDKFQSTGIDFTLGVVRFHHSLIYEWLGTDIVISKQTSDVDEIKEILRSIKVSGGERQIDALVKAVSGVKFRSGADRHFILITDEYVHGTYPVSEILKDIKRAGIIVDVIGRDEPFQRTIAEQTGGVWTPIEQLTGSP